MSCLSALGSQIFTLISVPHEILSLQHKVFAEYAKVAVSPDFSHTFPSFLVVIAVCIVLRKNLYFKWLPIRRGRPLYVIFQILFSWFIVNAVLWNWLVFQGILYCFVWTYWNRDFGIQQLYLPWWRKVWSSFYPPLSVPPTLSASFVSWILSMTLASIALWCSIYIDRVSKSISKVSLSIKKSFNMMKTYRLSSLKRPRARSTSDLDDVIEATDKSEIGSYCDDCRSEVSTDNASQSILTHREISPISYGTNWTPRPTFTNNNKKPQREISCRTIAGVTECRETEDNVFMRQLRNRRGCHTVPSSSSEKSNGC